MSRSFKFFDTQDENSIVSPDFGKKKESTESINISLLLTAVNTLNIKIETLNATILDASRENLVAIQELNKTMNNIHHQFRQFDKNDIGTHQLKMTTSTLK